jgi:hypothetical protein
VSRWPREAFWINRSAATLSRTSRTLSSAVGCLTGVVSGPASRCCGPLCERTETLGCGMQLSLAPAMLNTVCFVPKMDLKVDLGFIRARSVTTGGLFNPPVVTHLALIKRTSTSRSTFSFTKSLLSIAEPFQLNSRAARCTGPPFCGMGSFWSTATAAACP